MISVGRCFLACFGNITQCRKLRLSIIHVGDVEVDVLAQSWYIEEWAVEELELALGLAISGDSVGHWIDHDLIANRDDRLPCGAEDGDGACQLTCAQRSACSRVW
jgi:hypothetical protein